MYKVIIGSNAEMDLTNILLYISDTLKSPNAARRIYLKLKTEILSLKTMPYRCSLLSDEEYSERGIRKLIVENYIAFYVVNEEEKEVFILRIQYNKRAWKNFL